MKRCPVCLVSYPTEFANCPNDGASLLQSAEWLPGTLVRNRYRILSKLGQGGMGTVYKAEHTTLEEYRALKVLHSHLTSDPKFVRRFQQEAKVARRLRHKNIVHVDDLDQAEDGNLFIAMDYVEGRTVRQLLQATQGPLPVEQAIAIAHAVAEALSAAHAMNWVHRDIKPENILLGRDESGRDLPKVLDFGITALKETSRTSSSSLLLTPSYAAPEQWKGLPGAEIDGRADLYALGLTLYEMLTGRRPFEAQSFEQWMYAHLTQEAPPPSQLNPSLVGLNLDELVLKLLAKDREARPRDAEVFLAELAAVSGGLPAAVQTRTSTGLEPTLDARVVHDLRVEARTIPHKDGLPATQARIGWRELVEEAREARKARPTPRVRWLRRVSRVVPLTMVALLIVGGAVWIGLHWRQTEVQPQTAPAVTKLPPEQRPAPPAPDTEPSTETEEKPTIQTGSPRASPMRGRGQSERQVRTSQPGEIRTRLARALAALDEGRYDEAIAAYQDVLRVDPANKTAIDGVARATRAKSAEEELLRKGKPPGNPR